MTVEMKTQSSTTTPDPAPDPALEHQDAASAPQSQPEAATTREQSLATKIEELTTSLAEAHAALEAADRRRAVDEALLESGAIDLETARLLTERFIAIAAPPLTPAQAVAQLHRSKPFLFRAAEASLGAPKGSSRAGAMSERVNSAPAPLESAAAHAAATGDRASLLRYLRLRRAV